MYSSGTPFFGPCPNTHEKRTYGPPYEQRNFLKNDCDCSFERTLQCSHGTKCKVRFYPDPKMTNRHVLKATSP